MIEQTKVEMFLPDENGNLKYQDYLTPHIAAGDTDSVYIRLDSIFDRDSDLEDVIEVADYIGSAVNDSVAEFVYDIFNVPPERAKHWQTDREVVSDKSYFLAKKAYIMHVLDQEGKPCDYQKIMGVAIKKTDTPKIVQDLLRDVVTMIMDGATFEEVQQFIKHFKLDYQEKSWHDIGRPMNLNNLAKYEEMFNATGTLKGIPYQVRAAMFYNRHCTNRDMKLVSGNKIKICYIHHPDSDYIAIPVDQEILPDWMDDFYIDWKKQWEKVNKKLEAFLKPIGYDLQTRKKDNLNSVVTWL